MMNWVYRAAFVAIFMALAPEFAQAQSADLVLCDRLAADPTDPDKPADVKGVADVAPADIATAIKFCKKVAGSSRRAMFELGRAYAANRQTPEAVAAWLRDPSAAPHGGESILALLERVADWLSGEQSKAARTIVVTHAAVIRAAVVHAIGAPPQSFWRIDIAPLSITRLSGDKARWNIMSSGCTLPGD